MLLCRSQGSGVSGHMPLRQLSRPIISIITDMAFMRLAMYSTIYRHIFKSDLYGRRGTWNAGTAHDNRLQMQFMFTL